MKVKKSIKAILYNAYDISMCKEMTFKIDRVYFSKLPLLKRVVFSKHNIFDPLRTQIFSSRRNHAMKTTFYLEQNISFKI